MSATLRTQVGLMWLAPWQWRRNEGHLWTLWLCMGLSLAVLVVFWLADLSGMLRVATGAWLAVVLGVALLTGWGWHFAALLRLDHPHLARFAPGHSSALRTTALGHWLAVVAVTGLVATMVPGLSGSGGRPALLAVLVAAAVLLLVSLALRWTWLWLAMWLPFPLLDQPPVLTALGPAAGWVQQRWLEQPWLCTALALLAMACVLPALFGQGDAAHARAYASRERMRKALSAGAMGQPWTPAAAGRMGSWLNGLGQRTTDAWLAHVTARAQPTPRSVMARADVVMQGAQHAVGQVATTVVIQVVALLALATTSHIFGFDLRQALERGHAGLSIGLTSVVVTSVMSVRAGLWSSRREQALLMLLPGMPQGIALNRALARRHLQHFAIVWAAALPGLLLLSWWAQAPQALCVASAALPLGALMLRNFAVLGAPNATQALRIFGPWILLAALSMLLMRSRPDALLPWMLAMAGLCVVLLAWRWRQLARWPQALPAGRLG